MLMSAEIKLACQCFMLRGNNRAQSIFLGIKGRKKTIERTVLHREAELYDMAGNIYMYTGGAELSLSAEISHCDIKTW